MWCAAAAAANAYHGRGLRVDALSLEHLKAAEGSPGVRRPLPSPCRAARNRRRAARNRRRAASSPPGLALRRHRGRADQPGAGGYWPESMAKSALRRTSPRPTAVNKHAMKLLHLSPLRGNHPAAGNRYCRNPRALTTYTHLQINRPATPTSPPITVVNSRKHPKRFTDNTCRSTRTEPIPTCSQHTFQSELLTFPDGRFQPRDEGERARFAADDLYRRARKRSPLEPPQPNFLTPNPHAAVIVLGDLNDEVDAATIQVLNGPPGSEMPRRVLTTRQRRPPPTTCGTWHRAAPYHSGTVASTAAARNSSTTSSSATPWSGKSPRTTHPPMRPAPPRRSTTTQPSDATPPGPITGPCSPRSTCSYPPTRRAMPLRRRR